MITFFFYNKFIDIELIRKINKNFIINDGYILINSYDKENNILQINAMFAK
jgi:hypothetical protein